MVTNTPQLPWDPWSLKLHVELRKLYGKSWVSYWSVHLVQLVEHVTESQGHEFKPHFGHGGYLRKVGFIFPAYVWVMSPTLANLKFFATRIKMIPPTLVILLRWFTVC